MAKKNKFLFKKGDTVRIKAMKGICEYLHGLTGPVYKVPIRRAIKKRTVKSNWNPVTIGWENIYFIDLSAHSNRDLDSGNKKFQFPERMLTLI